MNELLLLSGLAIARRIREGSLSSREAVEAHIARIRAVNPTVNAVVADRFDAARAEADTADRARAERGSDALPRFHGVPCTIKEAFALQGMPNTGGLVSRRGMLAERDATAVARMRAVGCIPLGVTNISELCMWYESNNRVYGRSNNPYDPARIVGGSSGGEGAIVGAGGSPFGLGADIGGSIRMPAFFNGVFGHKPTGGMVPGTGQFPMASNESRRMLATGPIARRAEDLWPLLQCMAGPDGEDYSCGEFPLGDPTSVEISQLEVLDVQDNGVTPVSDDLRAAQARVAEYLASRGARVTRTVVPGLEHSLEIWSAIMDAAGNASFKSLMGNGRDINVAWELLRWAFRRTDHTLPALALALVEDLPKLLPARAKKSLERAAALRTELVSRIGPRGVMLYPSYASVAPKHLVPMFPPFNWVYTAVINAMELPSTQVPLGLDPRGIPLGVQVVGTHGNDHLTVAVALDLEKKFGGWVPPARYPIG